MVQARSRRCTIRISGPRIQAALEAAAPYTSNTFGHAEARPRLTKPHLSKADLKNYWRKTILEVNAVNTTKNLLKDIHIAPVRRVLPNYVQVPEELRRPEANRSPWTRSMQHFTKPSRGQLKLWGSKSAGRTHVGKPLCENDVQLNAGNIYQAWKYASILAILSVYKTRFRTELTEK